MPMVKWRVEPTVICKLGAADIQTRKAPTLDLTDVTNFIYSNVIRQLSCLCKQSQEMFDELHEMASNTIRRTSNLTNRVNSLRSMASRLNATVDEVSLDDIGAYKPFKSDVTKDPSFSRQRPQAVVDVYNSSQSVPALAKLNQFRSDGKDCVKMYTNPEFFFELWSNQITKEVNEKKPKSKKRRAQAQAVDTIRKPVNVKMEEMKKKVERQNEGPPPLKPKPQRNDSRIDDSKTETPSSAPDISRKPSMSDGSPCPPPPPITGTDSRRTLYPDAKVSRRPCDPPPPPPPEPPEIYASPGRESVRKSELLPPPPPPPLSPSVNSKTQCGEDQEAMDVLPPPPPVLRSPARSVQRGTLYSVGDFSRETAFLPPPPPPPQEVPPPPPAPLINAPPPPPPPPPPAPPVPIPVAPSTGSILPTPESAFQLKHVAPPTQKRESRSDLLQSIRVGITLRKVEETQTVNDVKQSSGALFDVQAILEMRRRAMEEESDEEEDESTWDE